MTASHRSKRNQLELMMQSISKKVLGDVAKGLNNAPDHRSSLEIANTLSNIFRKSDKENS